MSTFADALLRREERIDLTVPVTADPYAVLAGELLGSPAGTSAISGMSYVVSRSSLHWHLAIRIAYDASQALVPSFLVRDAFEMTCAMSMALRLHLSQVNIVVDNRGGFVPPDSSGDGFYEYMTGLRNSLGEDLECAQAHRTHHAHVRLCQNQVIVYRMGIDYYETPSMLNSLMCVVGEHAAETMCKANRDPIIVMDMLMGWFRDNVTYVNNGVTRDHSAVGLIVNGTSVCQGIAVYANQFLWACGIPNRYVSGMGRRERHAWNVVKVGDAWEHVDYTFALANRQGSILPLTAQDRARFRGCHTWDENEYSPDRNNRVATVKQTLSSSIVSVIPETPCYSVNGCIVDTTMTSHLCPVRDGKVRVNIGDLSKLLGGGWGIRNGGNAIAICIGSDVHLLPSAMCQVIGDACYIDATALPRLGLGVSIGGGNIVSIMRGA